MLENTQEVATTTIEDMKNEQPCCPKSKTTVLAIIDGEEKEITIARTIYSMEVLKKGQQKMLESVDRSKLLDEMYHFSTPEIFTQVGIKLFDLEGEEIAEGTENVLVPVETATTYWRFTFDEVLKNVQVHTFASVEEYAQVTGTTDLFSRSRNTVEKIGVAALATADDTYTAIYELCRITGMPGSTAMAYLGVQLKGSSTLEMTMGCKGKTPVASRSFDDAYALYKQVYLTFSPAEAKKRYAVRAVNSVAHTGGYDLKTIISAMKIITYDEVQKALLADCGTKEGCISSTITKCIVERMAAPLAA